MFLKISLVLMLLILLSECHSRRNRGRRLNRRRHRQRQQGNRAEARNGLLAQAANDFGISLYKQLVPSNPNLILAPVSALTVMSMVMLGAVGETKENLFQNLKLEPLRRPRKVGRAFKQYTRSLAGPHQNASFSSANAMFVHPDHVILRMFRRKVRRFYAGESRNFDFSNPGGPEAPVNEWIESMTNGMIQDFLSPGDIDDDTLMWLINAVFFNGTWEWTFDSALTSKQSFRVSPSREVEVDMMENDHLYATKYDSDLRVKVLELPYVGDRFTFFILLPDSFGLAALESRLSSSLLEGLLTNLDSPTQHVIYIPKFKLESGLNLKSPLQTMGVTKVFMRGVADLSGINGQDNLFVDKVKQKALIEVTERGTVAAAATAVRVYLVSLPLQPPPEVRVDRPFLFVLRDKVTATNIFMGRVVDPTAEE